MRRILQGLAIVLTCSLFAFVTLAADKRTARPAPDAGARVAADGGAAVDGGTASESPRYLPATKSGVVRLPRTDPQAESPPPQSRQAADHAR